MRAISTVLDVTVFLLLVSAAVLVVVQPEAERPPERTVGETANLLATTTGEVEYRIETDELPPGERRTDSGDSEDGRSRQLRERTRHGTLAGLLARAAVANATIDGERVAPESVEFRRGVERETQPLLPNRTSVRAQWVPYPGAPISGAIVVGDPPPDGTNTQMATLTVPLPGLASDTGDTSETYDDVANATAEAIVGEMLPASTGEFSRTDGPVVSTVSYRYRVLTGDGSFPVTEQLLDGNVTAVEESAVDELADRLAVDMRDQFDTPAEAAAATESRVVRLSVTRWYP